MSEAKRRADFERFVNRTETCWFWTGAKNPAGYGLFKVGQIRAGAHRWAWQWANGPIPQGMEVHHNCRTRPCVNPAHLEVMTRRQNLQRRKFDSWKGIDARIEAVDGEPLTVGLSPEHSAWVRSVSAQSGLSPEEIVSRAMYRYIARWLGQWADSSE
jgi:HNH endonuclease